MKIPIKKMAFLFFLLPTISFTSVELPEKARVEISEEDQERWKAEEMMRKICKTEEEKKEVKAYIQSHPDINKKYGITQDSLLHWAAAHGPPETVSLLINNKANVNQEEWCYFNPLIELILKALPDDSSAVKKAKILLKNGASFTPSEQSELTIKDLLNECRNVELKKEIEPAAQKIIEDKETNFSNLTNFLFGE